MITFKKTILILIIITLASCGNYKNNRLPEGTIDKSEFTYPPEKEQNNLKMIKELIKEYQTPFYCYDEAIINENINNLNLLLVSSGVPNPANCLIVHNFPLYKLGWIPLVNGN